MTPVGALLGPDGDPAIYVALITSQYVELPETPLRANLQDQRQARRWFDAGVPLTIVETALLLASLRRLDRPLDAPPLGRIRSLAYFQPVIDELLDTPPSPSYLDYLRSKLHGVLANRPAPSTPVHFSTFSRDR